MGLICRTMTKGFRACFFRNQPVHQFFGHLQAVMREISPAGEMDHLFAKPYVPSGVGGNAPEIEWMTDLNGDAVKFQDLPAMRQQEVAGVMVSSMEKIRAYAQARQGKSGVERDYADYLQAVAVSPDLSQVFVIQGKPVVVHWGFLAEGAGHPGQGIFAGWEDFIAQIQRKAPPPAPKPAPAVVPQPVPVLPPEPAQVAPPPAPEPKPEPKQEPKPVPAPKPAEPKKAPPPAKKPPAEKEMVACGLGEYQWVKWLAILLAIIILLLLFLRLLPPQQPRMPQQSGSGAQMGGGGSGGGSAGGSGGGMPSGSSGGSGGGQQGGGSGMSGGGQGGGQGGSQGGSGGSGEMCPSCGNPKHPQPSDQGQQPAGGAPGANGAPGASGSDGQDGTSGSSGAPGANGRDGKPGAPGAPGADGKPAGEAQHGQAGQHGQSGQPKSGDDSGVSIKEEGNKDYNLVSRPADPKTTWEIVDEKGNPIDGKIAFFQKTPGKIKTQGASVDLSVQPPAGKSVSCTVIATSPNGSVSKYNFLATGK